MSARVLALLLAGSVFAACGARTSLDDLLVIESAPPDASRAGDSSALGDAAPEAEADAESRPDAASGPDAEPEPEAGPDAGPDVAACGPGNCEGCCSFGVCLSGGSPLACGGGGTTCIRCGPEMACDKALHFCE